MASSSPKLACLLALVALLVAMTSSCAAQNSAQDYVNLHNVARAAVGVGPVSWNGTLAAYAKSFAEQGLLDDCEFKHSSTPPYGENTFWGSSGKNWTASDAVGSWVRERQYYDHGGNRCAPGKVCRHYTQVVWRDSTAIGCARVVCNYGGSVFITCNYSPPAGQQGGPETVLD